MRVVKYLLAKLGAGGPLTHYSLVVVRTDISFQASSSFLMSAGPHDAVTGGPNDARFDRMLNDWWLYQRSKNLLFDDHDQILPARRTLRPSPMVNALNAKCRLVDHL